MEKPTLTAKPGSLEAVVIHKFDAPIDLVYRIFTDPSLIPEWWGPRNLITTVEKMEIKPGGIWRYVQRDPQNNVFPFQGVYHSLEPNKRIVSTFEWEGMPGHVCFVTTTFDERDGKTIVIQQNIFQSIEDRDGMINMGMEQGMIEGDERFNELLVMLNAHQPMEQPGVQHDGRSLKIVREYNAPKERVWQEWTNPDMTMCWWGPEGFQESYAKVDLRVGGKYLNSMRGPDGKDIWSTGTYKEIVEPNRLVMTDSFADEQGNVVPASYYGMAADLPMEMEVEVTFEDIGGKTRMTLEHCGLPAEIVDQTEQSWNQSFDKLAECLQ